MNTPKYTQALRLHLLDMSKLSLRAVDYAIKDYKLGSPEFCRYVCHDDRQVGELRHKITDLCRKLLVEELDAEPDVFTRELDLDSEGRFPLSALRICGALYATCTAAIEIAQNVMFLLEEASVPTYAALKKLCDLVNRLMCLCIVALFKKEIHHAEKVLQNREVARLLEQAFYNLRDDMNGQIAVPTDLELAITKSLGQIARQAHEIADAIVFWLDGKWSALESDVIACR
jgi:phosphate uptake regulator